MKQLHIVIFLPSLAGGGAERNMVNFANGLHGLGQRVTVVIGDASGPYEDELDPDIRLIELHQDRALACLGPLVEALEELKPDWLFSTLSYANMIAIWASLLCTHKVRAVVREAVSLQGMRKVGTMKSLIFEALQMAAYAQADLIIAPSNGIVSEFQERGIEAQVLNSPIITPLIREMANEPNPWRQPFVLAVGRLVWEKGFDTLIKAWAKTDREGRDLLILGEGPLRADLVALRDELGLRSSVHFLGFVSNPFKFMAHCDTFVLSSRFEGMPNVLVQAMACGAPVIATDCPTGPREILGQRSGQIVPVDDHDALAHGISESFTNTAQGAHTFDEFDQKRVCEELIFKLRVANGSWAH